MTSPSVVQRLAAPPRWLKGALIAIAVVMITVQWVNTRVSILRLNQKPSSPMVLATYPVYHSMATGMREGRIGQVDLLALRRYSELNELSAPFERLPPEAEHQWVNFYTLDVGYSFIVEAARLAFPSLPDNHLRPLALQLVVDVALTGFIFFVFSQWAVWLGLLASYLYVSNGVFYDLVSFAYYYYWDIPLTFVVLGSLILAYRRQEEAGAWLTVAAVALGFGVWLRGSWWPLSLFLVTVALWVRPLRRKMLMPILAFAVLATPQVVRSSLVRGQLTFTTRAVWHVALVGLGYYPNPYGLRAEDGAVFELTRQKYGVEFKSQDYWLHDQAARKEFLSIWAHDHGFVIRSFLGRLTESIAGRTQSSVFSFLFLSNGKYRLLCLLGFFGMLWRGGEKRLLAIATAGSYSIYVVLTCVFYYVGLAYDNVPEVTLLILFLGGIEAAIFFARTAIAPTGIRVESPMALGQRGA
jgi:hypothetical protein